MAGTAGCLLDSGAPAQHDQIRQRHSLRTTLSTVERRLDCFERRDHARQLGWVVGLPAVLGCEPDSGTVGPASHVAVTERRRRCPCGLDQLGSRQARFENRGFQRCDIGVVDELVVDSGDRVLPDQHFVRHLRTEVARGRTHVAVGELVPGPRKGISELVGVLEETPRDRFVDGVHPQRQVGGEHDRRVPLRRIVRVGHGVGRSWIGGHPLMCTRRALGQLPLVAEQHLEERVVPRHRRGRPDAFEAAGDRIACLAAAERARPAEALLFQGGAFRFGADVSVAVSGAVCLAERVAAGDESHSLLVVHCHSSKGLPDVPCGGQRIRGAVGPFGVHIDEAHLHGTERVGQITVSAVALVVEPDGLGAPVDVLLGLPHVFPAAAEAEGLEAHRLQRHIAGQDHQVGPGDLAAVLLLDRPQQPASLVEVGVVGPAVQRCESVRARAAAASAVMDAVGAGAVPRHADDERPVVAEVGWPPIL